MIDIGKLKAIRESAGISQCDLAKMLKVTPGAISQWEHGLTNPSTKNLKRLAEILRCKIDDLI